MQKSLGKALDGFMKGLDFHGLAHTAEASSDVETFSEGSSDSENPEENGSDVGLGGDLAEEEEETDFVSITRGNNTTKAPIQAAKTVKTVGITQDEQPNSGTVKYSITGIAYNY